MAKQTTPHIKSMVGRVVSAGSIKTVSVEVTTLKVHPLYRKRYRWTKKYLSDTGELEPKVGDMVKIVANRPISRRKRWMVTEVVTPANVTVVASGRKPAKTAAKSSKAKKS
jgi:small subunit ribosomal protein S17